MALLFIPFLYLCVVYGSIMCDHVVYVCVMHTCVVYDWVAYTCVAYVCVVCGSIVYGSVVCGSVVYGHFPTPSHVDGVEVSLCGTINLYIFVCLLQHYYY